MKHLKLSEDERRTLREMGVFHPHPRTRMRAQGVLRLSQGLTLQRTADEFGGHLNSVEQWRQRWSKLGLAGLYEGRHTGRPRKWTPEQQQALGKLADSESGTVGALLRQIEQGQDHASISESTAKRYLKEMDFTYKRYRYSLKKASSGSVRARRQSDRRSGQARSGTAVRAAVFRRIRLQPESAGAVRLGKNRPDPSRRASRAPAARERAWGFASRWPTDLDNSAATDDTRRCHCILRTDRGASA